MKSIFRGFLNTIGLLLLVQAAFAQNVSVTYGPDQFALNQNWTITITVENDRLRKYSDFPEIDGLVKRDLVIDLY
jgi:hypothetical protein